MSLPDMNPLASKLMGGREFREKLRENLVAAAERTDDEAYRARLLAVANGERPLRALAADPAFQAEHRLRDGELDEQLEEARRRIRDEGLDSSPEEMQARIRDQAARFGIQIPSVEEMRSIFEDALRLEREAQAVVRAEELNGWEGTGGEDR